MKEDQQELCDEANFNQLMISFNSLNSQLHYLSIFVNLCGVNVILKTFLAKFMEICSKEIDLLVFPVCWQPRETFQVGSLTSSNNNNSNNNNNINNNNKKETISLNMMVKN